MTRDFGRSHVLEDVGLGVAFGLEPVKEGPQRPHPVVHGGGGRPCLDEASLLEEEYKPMDQLQVHGRQGSAVAVFHLKLKKRRDRPECDCTVRHLATPLSTTDLLHPYLFFSQP